MRKIEFALAAAALAALAMPAAATPVYGAAVAAANWTGQRTLTTGGGLNSAGTGNNPFETGTGISWVISLNPVTGVYTYSYTFFEPAKRGSGNVPLEMSHFILELSPGCITEGQSECVWDFDGDMEFRSSWDSSGPGKSNPGLPGSIYGVKFDEELSTYTFLSDRNPVWGHFYAKKANDGLWNLGLEQTYSNSSDTLYFIPRPDTGTPGGEIPEPGTLALLGAGLASLVLLRRKGQA